jgi:tetratricopeptide (TPR) repeat protein
MLSEEALIVLAAFGACGLLVLGVLELVWPTRPRHPVRVRRPPARRPLVARSAQVHRTGALDRHALGPGGGRDVRRVPVPPPVEASAPVAASIDRPARLLEPVGAARVGSVVDECFALQQAGHHAQVVEVATAALHGGDEALRPGDAHGTAALWSVVALARQGLGDDAAARTALEAAVAAAPTADRPTYQRQLGTLADGVARRLLAEAEQHPRGDTEECLEAIRTATEWLEHGVAAMPADTTLVALSLSAQEALWRAYERAVMAFLQRHEFRAARRLLREALADPRFPPARVEAFREMFTGTFSGEIGQLTAHAIRSVQDAREADAIRSLRRAETLLGTLNDEALSPKRREEVDLRLWWVYSKLGERRLESGDHEGALEPLVHALGHDVGAERHEQTRSLLERALDGCADREAAIVHCDRLWARLHGATETLVGEDLAGAAGTTQRLLETQER